MSDAEAWTIGRLLKWTETYLSQHGSDSPRLDAEVLLAHAKQCQRIELYTAFDELASEELRNAFRQLVKQRASGKPVAYLVESREFYSLPFAVSPAVLIPRPETEFLVLRLLDLAKARTSSDPGVPLTIIDVGTGSGIIAICAAIYLPTARVIAIDLSHDAIEVAKCNARTHGVADRIEFRQGDLLQGVTEQADFVVSNPPYVSEAEFQELDKTVREYEPRQALIGGATGTELIEKIIDQAVTVLPADSWLLIEISPFIVDSVQATASSNQHYRDFQVTRDLAKLPRVVEMRRSTN